MNYLIKYLTAFATSLVAMILDARWMLVIMTFAVIADCITAYRLSRRVRKKYPDKSQPNDGYFSTEKATSKAYRLLAYLGSIIFALILDSKVMVMWDGIYLANYVTVLFCVLEAISCLENESSCSDSRIALFLQKILVDKTQRHLGIDLNPLIKDKNES
jgi:hypothetical protein